MIWFGEPFCSFDMTCMPWHVGVSRIWWMNNVLDNMVETALHGTGWGRGGVLWSSQVLAHTRLLFLSKDDFCACVRQHACPLSWRIFFVCDLSSKLKHAKQSRESGGLGLFFGGGGWADRWVKDEGVGKNKKKPNQVRSRKITAWRWSRQHGQLCMTLLNKLFRLLHFIKGSERAHALIHYSLILLFGCFFFSRWDE